MSFVGYAVILGCSIGAGYGIFLLILSLLPKKLNTENVARGDEVLGEAKKQSQVIKTETVEVEDEKIALIVEELESELKERREVLLVTEEDMQSAEHFLQMEENRISKQEKGVNNLQIKINSMKNDLGSKRDNLENVTQNLRRALEERSRNNSQNILRSLKDNIVESRQIESQKQLRFLQEDLQTNSRRLAKRLLSTVCSRYTPNFIWPKTTNYLELSDEKAIAQIKPRQEQLTGLIKELANVDLETYLEEDGSKMFFKLTGGGGLEREALRMTLEAQIARKSMLDNEIINGLKSNLALVNNQAQELGRKAVAELKLANVHPELQKMLGSLYWRTSYRQNQYYHSIEVAKLSGILATEFREDENLAKRCALLHDIGKALDYKIEGSHAIISGDYADRYGESRIICDTIMAHHNDIQMDNMLINILKTSDTLSGARPGARVNLEEGYQIRLSAIDDAVKSFSGITKTAIMNGGREVHIEVNHKKIHETDLQKLSAAIAKKIEEEVAFPGQIKILVNRRFEAVTVA